MIYHSSYLVGLAVGNWNSSIIAALLLFIIYGRLTIIRCASWGRDADPSTSHQVPVTTHWVLWPTEMWIWKEWDFDGHYWPHRDYWNLRIVYQGLSNIISGKKQICKTQACDSDQWIMSALSWKHPYSANCTGESQEQVQVYVYIYTYSFTLILYVYLIIYVYIYIGIVRLRVRHWEAVHSAVVEYPRY